MINYPNAVGRRGFAQTSNVPIFLEIVVHTAFACRELLIILIISEVLLRALPLHGLRRLYRLIVELGNTRERLCRQLNRAHAGKIDAV